MRNPLIAMLATIVLFACFTARAVDKNNADSEMDAQNDKTEAQKHFRSGLTLMKAEEFESAAIEFEVSVKFYPTKNGLFNLANCYKALKRYQEALDALSTLNVRYKGELSKELRETVDKLEQDIRNMVAELKVQVNKKGATIKLDGKAVGKSPLAKPLLLAPGNYEVTILLEKYGEHVEKVKLISGDMRTLDIELLQEGGAVATESDTPENDSDEIQENEGLTEDTEGRKKLGPVPLIVAAGLTVGLGVTTIVINKKVGEKSDEAKTKHDESLMEDADGLQVGGQVFMGLSFAALAATTVLLFFTDFKGGEEETTEPVALDRVSPMVVENGGGLLVGGRF